MQNNNYIPYDFTQRSTIINQILFDIINSPYGNQIIFKGWTMMSLFLNSNRFSEDIDLNPININNSYNISEWIYNHLLSLWYSLWPLHTDWTNLYNIEVFYEVNWNPYNCQVEIFKDNFWLKDDYYQDVFYWKPINILAMEQSFAHKCCAYIERWNKKLERSGRPKWRDLFDILHYVNMNINVDLNIINKRLWLNNNKQLFQLIYKKTVIDNYKSISDFWYEIENFSYNKINWVWVIENLLNIINKNYLDWKVKYNIHYLNDLKEIKENNISIDSNIICYFDEWFYKIFDIKKMKFIYETKIEQKIKDYIKDYIILQYFS